VIKREERDRVAAAVVASGNELGDLAWNVDRRSREPQGREYLGSHELRIRLAGDSLDQVADDPIAQIGVLEDLAWRKYQVSITRDRLFHRRRRVATIGIEELGVQGKASRMAQHPADRRAVRVTGEPVDSCCAEVCVGRSVEVDLT